MRATDLADTVGISYRQLDHWTRNGWIVPRTEANGSGTQRDYDPPEVEVVAIMADLVRLGIKPDRAVELARLLQRTPAAVILGGRYVLVRAAGKGTP